MVAKIFPRSEYELRIKRAKELMKKERLDAIIATHMMNFQYLTAGWRYGFDPVGVNDRQSQLPRPGCVIVPLDGDPVALAARIFSFNKERGWVDDVRTWHGLRFTADYLKKELDDMRLTKGRIGMELGEESRIEMPYDEFEKLKKDLPNVSFVSSNIFWDLRMCKSKAEADKIRKAAEITGKGLERFYAKAKENMKIKDVIRTLFDCYMEEGALRPSFPPNLGWKDIEATTFKKGKAYSLDTAAVFDDYTADISRVIVIGRATQQHKEIYEKAVKLNDAVRKTSRAGTRTKELWNVYQKTITELGFAPKDGIPLWGGWPDRIGHGFGLAGNEPPTIGPNDPHTLRVGDVHCIEPGLAHGDEYIYIEEDVWVTESGSELLSSSVSRDLREIT